MTIISLQNFRPDIFEKYFNSQVNIKKKLVFADSMNRFIKGNSDSI